VQYNAFALVKLSRRNFRMKDLGYMILDGVWTAQAMSAYVLIVILR